MTNIVIHHRGWRKFFPVKFLCMQLDGNASTSHISIRDIFYIKFMKAIQKHFHIQCTFFDSLTSDYCIYLITLLCSQASEIQHNKPCEWASFYHNTVAIIIRCAFSFPRCFACFYENAMNIRQNILHAAREQVGIISNSASTLEWTDNER